jgi:metal-responsive CopG/Arc/MetJ family transcriptional regulator
MSKEKITVTIEEDLVKEIDRTAKIINKSRSYLVEEAIGTWKRARIEQGLKKGYLAMAEEDLATAEANLPVYEAPK